MFAIFKEKLSLDFMRIKNRAFVFSAIVIILGIASFAMKGREGFGVDFTGGCLHQLRFENSVDMNKVREGLRTLDLGGIPVQQFGGDRDIILKAPLKQGLDLSEIAENINQSIRSVYPQNPFRVMRTEIVGPAVGSELRNKSIKAALLAIICIALYVAFRFELFYAFGALVALVHDGIVVLGLCSLFGIEISLNVVAAVLTVLGYSINDTIVIFDRIREERKLQRKERFYDVINSSINRTLNRTVITSLTTMIVALCLFFFGGEVIHDFSFALFVGVITGTYSSIYIASGMLLVFQNRLTKA